MWKGDYSARNILDVCKRSSQYQHKSCSYNQNRNLLLIKKRGRVEIKPSLAPAHTTSLLKHSAQNFSQLGLYHFQRSSQEVGQQLWASPQTGCGGGTWSFIDQRHEAQASDFLVWVTEWDPMSTFGFSHWLGIMSESSVNIRWWGQLWRHQHFWTHSHLYLFHCNLQKRQTKIKSGRHRQCNSDAKATLK